MLNVVHSIPDGLLDLSAAELHTLLPGPTLMHLPGAISEPMFISVLLHGNEHTGWDAVRHTLFEYQDKTLPRSLSIFIGNIEAARENKRFLSHQQDYNRVWIEGDSEEHRIMHEVTEQMKQRQVFLSIDIHNNTGNNPHYACINNTYPQFLQIATLFSRTIVYFIRPKGVQSMCFAELCPSVTVECGKSGEALGIQQACEFIQACLKLESLSDHMISSEKFDLYHTIATVKIDPRISFSFDPGTEDLILDREIESSNFNVLAADSVIGKVNSDVSHIFDIRDEQGNQVDEQFFYVESGELRTRRDIVPAMITSDIDVIKKDCFCYLMERYPL